MGPTRQMERLATPPSKPARHIGAGKREVREHEGEKVVRRRDAEATRAKILRAAVDQFAAKGMDARIEDIAESADSNRGMAYYYFGSKKGLYLAALEATYLELVQKEKAIDVAALGPLEAIATLVTAKFDHYLRYPRYLKFINLENMYEARFLKDSKRLKELQGPMIAVLRRVLKEGCEQGIFCRDVDPVEFYVSICGLGYFAFSNRFTLKAVFDVDPASERSLLDRRKIIVDMVTTYLTSPSPEISKEFTRPSKVEGTPDQAISLQPRNNRKPSTRASLTKKASTIAKPAGV